LNDKGEYPMSAYVVVDIEVLNPEEYREYAKLAPAAVAACGGKYLARAGRTEVLEGDWIPKRLVILEFDSVEKAKAWLESPEYQPARQMRHRNANTNMVVIEGL
jgi:uncharacterized protein (DUF1330 family)